MSERRENGKGEIGKEIKRRGGWNKEEKGNKQGKKGGKTSSEESEREERER